MIPGLEWGFNRRGQNLLYKIIHIEKNFNKNSNSNSNRGSISKRFRREKFENLFKLYSATLSRYFVFGIRKLIRSELHV